MTMTAVLSTKLREVLESPAPPESAKEIVATRVADTHCVLGECVLYDDATDKVLWTDIEGKALYRLELSSGSLEKITLPKMLGAFALRKSQKGYLCAWEDGFQLYDVETNTALSEMSQGEDVNPSKLPARLNDGRCDVRGQNFICGGYYGSIESVRMKVFKCCADKDSGRLHHEPILEGIQTSNSLCFSPDGEYMYFSDSPTKIIRKYKYNQETGIPILDSEQELWKWESVGDPDGSCTDAQGFVWNALWRKGAGPGMVHRIDPSSGKVVFTVHIPDATSQCTCCCLGGKDMDVLFISTASIDRDSEKEPDAGALYAVKVGVSGRKESRFDG